MNIQESVTVIREKHPFWESLKTKLIEEESKGILNKRYTNIIGKKSLSSPSFDAPSKLIAQWVQGILQNKYRSGGVFNAITVYYNIEMWFAKYGKGDYTKKHDHLPFGIFSFVYFVQCPKGSSPLVFSTSGKKVKAEEGEVVIFPGWVKHHVPKNNCDGRITLAGILLVKFDQEQFPYFA